MALPTYTYSDIEWAIDVAAFAKKELYGIGKDVNFWALMWDAMLRDAELYSTVCVSNLPTCNS
jgi:methionyl-tRNA synthetase